MRNTLKTKKPGFVMPLAMFAVVILLIMGSGLLTLGLHNRLLAARTTSEIGARCTADAGLTRALYEMNEKLKTQPWDNNSLPQVVNVALPHSTNAFYSYTITSNPDYVYPVNVFGRSGKAVKRVSGTIVLLGLFHNAVYAQNSLVLENGFLIDAYSSEQGPYGGANALQPGADVATDANAPGSTKLGQGTIYGDFLVDYSMYLPPMPPPDDPLFKHSKGQIVETVVFTADDSGKYDLIDLGIGKKLTIDGDVVLYVTGEVSVTQYSEVEILPDSSLTLYLGGNLTARNTSIINGLTQEPKRCKVYAVGSSEQTIVFEQSSVFYGTIYAPNADVSLENGAELYGAVIASDAELRNSSELHYDATLAKASVDEFGAKFIVQRWRDE